MKSTYLFTPVANKFNNGSSHCKPFNLENISSIKPQPEKKKSLLLSTNTINKEYFINDGTSRKRMLTDSRTPQPQSAASRSISFNKEVRSSKHANSSAFSTKMSHKLNSQESIISIIENNAQEVGLACYNTVTGEIHIC